VTIAASALLTISALGQSLAGSYAVILASWTLFGDRHCRPAHAPAPLHHSVPVTLSGDPFE
jgi:hypothetical protein